MKLETFFEKFDQFADAPDAAVKMRDLVMQFAVQGRLVTQCPEDEPADALAVSISEDRAAFVKARNLARQRVFDPVADDQYPFVLPSGWVWTRLGNLCCVQAGFAFASTAFVQGDAGVPMIRIRDITGDRTQVNYVGEYREEFLVDPGDYLVGMDGNFTVAKWRGPRALLNQRVSRLQWYSERLEPSFFVIAAQYRLSELQGTKAYTTVDHLSSGQIENAVVPLPPLAEQKRIVAKLDELMKLCDRLGAQQQERETRQIALARASLARFADAPTPANLQFLFHPAYTISPADLRKSILTLAVQGKLVEGDTAEEPADSLFAEMQKRREQLIDAKKIRKPRDLPPVTEDELPFSVPDSWRWTRWGQICDWITYGFTRPMAHVEKGPPIVTAKNVQDGFMTFENAHRAEVSEFADLNPKDVPRKGDILITKDGTIGRAAVVETDEAFCINQSVAVLWLESCLLYRPFMLMVIRSPFAQGPIWEAAEGMAIKHLSITDFGRMIFPVPPLAEQRRIVAKVDQLMALVDQLETQLGASRATAANLLEALVAGLTNQSTSFHPNGKIKSPDKIIPIRDDAVEDLLKVAEPTGKYGS